jgi:hypothetical protein
MLARTAPSFSRSSGSTDVCGDGEVIDRLRKLVAGQRQRPRKRHWKKMSLDPCPGLIPGRSSHTSVRPWRPCTRNLTAPVAGPATAILSFKSLIV